MKILTVDHLKKRLQWPEVICEQKEYDISGTSYISTYLRVMPSDPAWPAIVFTLDAECRYLHSLAFSEGHSHYEAWSDERRNVVDAVRQAARLVKQQLCMVEELDVEGNYLAGHYLLPTEMPEMIRKKTVNFRRTLFNDPPTIELVDFSKYNEEGSLLVRRDILKL